MATVGPLDVRRTRVVAAAPEVVWAALADFAGIVQWAPDVDHSSALTEPADGIGAARRVQVGRTTLVETISEWGPPSRLAYTIEGLPPVVPPVSNVWDLTAADGGTDVVLTSRFEPTGRPSRAVARVAGLRIGRASERMLAGLAAFTEGRA